MKLKITKNVEIKSVEQWEKFAPPMDEKKQWKDGRSAKSLAQFMMDKNCCVILDSLFKELGYNTRKEINCTPEANTPLPGQGNGRNHDLLMIGEDFVAGIEAKVTESFGNTIQKEAKGASENKQYRIDSLVKDLFNCEVNEDIEDLRYQLLTGAVGTLFEAIRNQKSKALFLIIVFTNAITEKDKRSVERNNEDFIKFCSCLGLGKDGGTKCYLNINLTIKKIEVDLKNENPAFL